MIKKRNKKADSLSCQPHGCKVGLQVCIFVSDSCCSSFSLRVQ
nr:MAG TPA: hypothetical protein [Caudoviricetes sp.]